MPAKIAFGRVSGSLGDFINDSFCMIHVQFICASNFRLFERGNALSGGSHYRETTVFNTTLGGVLPPI